MSAFAELDVRDQAHLHSIGANTPSAAWPDPDMTVIRPDRPGAPEMSDADLASVFGSWTEWLKSAAAVKSTHVDYVALGLLSTASAIIGNTRWAVPWDGWKEPPIVWGMLIGDPSSGKSPALDAVLDPIKEIDAEFTRQYKAEREEWSAKDELAHMSYAQWKQDAKAALQDGQTPPEKPEDASAGAPPTRKRARITDATTESVADLLSTTWRGLLLSRDELSGWLGSMDRYSGGGDRPFWLEAFGGRSYTVDRKGKPDPIIVDHLSISVLGGTQPDKLDSMLVHSDDDGLTARFLTVFPDPVPLAKGPQGKKPLCSYKGKRRPIEMVIKLMSKRNSRMFGIRLENLAVVDVDEREPETMALVERRFGKATVQVDTPRGRHFYYQRGTGPLPGLRKEGLPIDIKTGVNSYVVGPGSVRPDGGVYTNYICLQVSA